MESFLEQLNETPLQTVIEKLRGLAFDIREMVECSLKVFTQPNDSNP
jgi:hypothetical protein